MAQFENFLVEWLYQLFILVFPSLQFCCNTCELASVPVVHLHNHAVQRGEAYSNAFKHEHNWSSCDKAAKFTSIKK